MTIELPLIHDGKSSRSSITCKYKCANACFHPVPNESDNEYFGDVVKAAMSRRGVLKGTATVALAVGAGGVLAACGDEEGSADSSAAANAEATPQGANFTAVAPNTEDKLVIPEGYEQGVVIRWGEPLFADAPKFDFDNQTPQAQERQWGFNNDFSGLLPIEGEPNKFLLVANFEYTTPTAMFKGYNPEAPTLTQFQVMVTAQGLGVVQVKGESGSGKLTPEFSKYSRRVTANSEFFLLTGPAAGSDFVKTSADPAGTKVIGTFANCSGGITPWGTMLSGEENFNGYFANAEKLTDENAVKRAKRYGITQKASEQRWENFDKRFDVAQEPNEPNRFGYIVELNPWDATSVPVKHSAMGRLKHEGSNVYVAADGTVVAYTGDDERFDYMYKFVSSRKVQSGNSPAAVRDNMKILDEGTLYVAKLTGNEPDKIDGSGKVPSDKGFTGSGEWIPLLESRADGATSKVEGFSAQEVAVFTRLAADKVGATKMDRPEDFEANPKTGKVYVALTNNDKRGADGSAAADEANPRKTNKNGQILEIEDDHKGTKFTWSLLVVCGDPKAADTYYGGFDKEKVSPISCPDNVAFDQYGNLWVSTDGNALKSNDGLFYVGTDGKNRGEVKQFLTVPKGAETCGPIVTENRVLVSVQHPGELEGASADKPVSHWPDGGDTQPRPSVVAVWKAGGGRIGV